MAILGVFVYYAILPRRFDIFTDSLDFVLGFSRWRVPLDSITGIERPRIFQSTLFFYGARFGGWPAETSIIETRAPKPWYIALAAPSPDVLISARNHNAFIETLRDARAKYVASKATM